MKAFSDAMAESFFASLKRELVDDEHFATERKAAAAVFEWLIWYNAERLHSAPIPAPSNTNSFTPTTYTKQHECPLRWGKSTPC